MGSCYSALPWVNWGWCSWIFWFFKGKFSCNFCIIKNIYVHTYMYLCVYICVWKRGEISQFSYASNKSKLKGKHDILKKACLQATFYRSIKCQFFTSTIKEHHPTPNIYVFFLLSLAYHKKETWQYKMNLGIDPSDPPAGIIILLLNQNFF